MEDQERLLDYLRRVTAKLQDTQQRLRDAERGRTEPIAIVSTACRLPGGVRGPEDLWELVSAGRDVVGEMPAERGWDLEAAGSVTTRGGFLDDALRFDAAFFGISPREALGMDPQQRLLLEGAWEAVERGRLDPTSLRGSRTGVFAGVIDEGYATRVGASTADVDGYILTGSTTSVASGRVAYTLGLEGPAVTVDTACSSSLVAIHLACQSLRLGECDLALAGGVLVMSTPSTFAEFSRQGALSGDGRCRAFAAEASGFGLSEGVALVLLERLSDAQRAGHPIGAVIRGSAVNQDGASNGLTAPNGPSQQRVIRAALVAAGLTADQVDAVEAHGTGTRLGDPIEARALVEVYGRDRPAERPLFVGSLKSNIGHTQAAAGAASVVKMVEALRRGVLPPTLHAGNPSPLIDWAQSGLALLTEPTPWPRTERPTRAGVSAFGISGTNVHMILEAAPEPPGELSGLLVSPRRNARGLDARGPDAQGLADAAQAAATPADGSASDGQPGPVAWPLSARDEGALRAQAVRLAAHLQAYPELRPVDVGYSLAVTRAVLPHRAVLVGATHEELLAGLRAVARGRVARTLVRATAPAVEPGEVAFVFPGQGSQWAGMARELMDDSAAFRARLADCADALDPYLEWPVLRVLRGEVDAPLEQPDVVQPALFAMMVALAEVWRAHGVTPGAVVGHSQGEIAAACVAGALSLDEAARVVSLRSRVAMELSGTGGLLSLALPEAEARERLARWGDELDIAVVNSPRSVVVGGPPGAVEELRAACEADGVRSRRVRADYASHTPQVEAVRERLREVLGEVRAVRAEIPIHSTVTGEVLDGPEMDAAYWYRNLRGAVRFETATRRLLDAGYRTFAEVSPHPVLATAMEETVEAVGGSGAIVVGTLRRDEGGLDRVRRSLADAYVRGANVPWREPLGQAGGQVVDLPPTAFLGELYWPDVQAAAPASGEVADRAIADFWAAVESGDLDQVGRTLAVRPEASAAELVNALGDWHLRATAVAGWRYAEEWEPLPRHGAASPRLTGRWLVVVPASLAGGPLVAGVRAMFAAHGADTDLVTVPADGIVPPLGGGGPTAGVLSLLALDTAPHPAHPDLPGGLAVTLALVRAWAASGSAGPLWCATQRAVSVGRSDPLTHPEQAAVWGLGRVAALEHPDCWGGLVDLPDSPDDGAWARLAWVIAAGGDEDQLAVRGSGVFARRLRRAAATGPAVPDGWRPEGSVLITGGTGALGGHVARYLARQGAGHLLLVSRRGLRAPGAGELAVELRALGAQVSVEVCDVADKEALRAVVDRSAAAGAPVRAVVHTAGVPVTLPLAEATDADLAHALAGKVTGARHLHEMFSTADALDAFVVFSSGSGVWGAGGQGPYAAANAALDALTRYRQARGLPATAVAWGLWQGDGMADGATGAELRRRGMVPMAPERAVRVLADAVTGGDGAVTVADIAWKPFLTGFLAARPSSLFDAIPEALELKAVLSAGTETGGSGLAGELRPLGPTQRRDRLRELITEQAAAVLKLPDAEPVATGRPFRELGFDSLTAVELRNRMAAATGLALPTTVVFDHPTVDALAAHVGRELLADLGPAADGTPATVAAATVVPAAVAGAVDQTVADDPIAIVGMACRYPGGADDPDALWRLVAAGTDAIAPVPGNRGWNLGDRLRDRRVEGGFLADAGAFDAEFFGLSPREALTMDPQQRLVLEASWEAIERAGLNPRSLRGTRTAVMTGIVSQDYADLLREAVEADGFRITGGSAAVVSGRVAYQLGLVGPAVTVDTACSSSLVALHLACQALRHGEADLALAGGATVMVSPTPFLEFHIQQGLSSDCRCHAFAASADGTGWGEGVGILLLERLSAARAHGRVPLALIRGSALNQDGASNGLTAPSSLAQQDVIRQALAAAGLTAGEVDAVEAHGTATQLGDPIEARALLATYGQDRPAGRPLWLGSLKSNIGHTQAAAGVGGVIKMVQALRHGTLPPTLHVDAPTPHVDWSGDEVRLLTEPVTWPRAQRPRRAAVSAFGISGTNAHVILEEGPAAADVPAPAAVTPVPNGRDEVSAAEGGARSEASGTRRAGGVVPLIVAGHGRAALAAQAERLVGHVDAHPGLGLGDLGHALAATRAQLTSRAVVLAADHASARAGLLALANGDDRASEAIAGTARERPKLALLCPGQGSQRIGIGRALHAAFPGYAAAFDLVCAEFDRHLDSPLAEVLFGTPGSMQEALLDQTAYAQPALFAVEVALARLLDDFGIRPYALLGHSIGELAAVHLAGALPLADACELVAARGRLMQAQPTGGAMVAVEASAAELEPDLPRLAGRVALAAVNGPRAVVISGDADAVAEVAAYWRDQGRRTRNLRVSHPFHSPHMAPLGDELARIAGRLRWSATTVPVVSNLTGEPLTAEQLASGAYWARHARETVRFADGLRWLRQHGVTVALELGGEGTLTGLARAAADQGAPDLDPLADEVAAIPALRSPRPEVEALVRALSELHVRGVGVDWTALLTAAGHQAPATPAPLPTTAFQRKHFWLRPAAKAGTAPPAAGPGAGLLDHPVLKTALALADDDSWVFTGRLSRRDQPWLVDHAIAGTPVVPGIALAELALRAGAHLGVARLDELTFPAALLLPDDGAVEVQVRVGRQEETDGRAVSVYGRPPAGASAWVLHAEGRLVPRQPLSPAAELAEWPPPGAQPADAEDLYRRLAGLGYPFGPAFRSVRRLWRRGEEWFTEVRLPADYEPDAGRFQLHPALLDSAGHPLLEGFAGTASNQNSDVPVLFALTGVQVDAPGTAELRARLVPRGRDTMEMTLTDASGQLAARVDRLTVRAAPASRLGGAVRPPLDAVFRLSWTPVAAPLSLLSPRDRCVVIGATMDGQAPPLPADMLAYPSLAAFTAAVAAGAAPPESVIVPLALVPQELDATAETVAAAARDAVRSALGLVRGLLAEPGLRGRRLLVVTTGAVAVHAAESGDHVAAGAVWGLLSSAQAEYPGRIVLADVDDQPASWRALADLDRLGEPQVALRAGAVWRPRLTAADPSSAGTGTRRRLAPEGTVLITGASGALGRQVARHLAAEHGVRHLLLLSRRGACAPGMDALTAELTARGTHAEVIACDVADRAALASALATVPPERPLTAVMHAAGVLDDALLGDVTGEQVERVLRPKVDGALNLLELTRGLPIADMVWFSSAAAVVGNVGQAAYAAANAALDALARRGRGAGLPVRSLAWGPWADPDGMAGGLGPAAAGHLRRLGVLPLTTAAGLALIEATAGLPDPVLLIVQVDRAAIARAQPGQVPPLLAGLAHGSASARPEQAPAAQGAAARDAVARDAVALPDRLAALEGQERAREVLHLVLTEVARVLGHGQPDEVDARQPFLDLGFTSLTAVELRNELSTLTRLRLPATLVFEFPTPVALARHLVGRLANDETANADATVAEAAAAPPSAPVQVRQGPDLRAPTPDRARANDQDRNEGDPVAPDDLPPLLALEPIQ